jgi:hypothetical protein
VGGPVSLGMRGSQLGVAPEGRLVSPPPSGLFTALLVTAPSSSSISCEGTRYFSWRYPPRLIRFTRCLCPSILAQLPSQVRGVSGILLGPEPGTAPVPDVPGNSLRASRLPPRVCGVSCIVCVQTEGWRVWSLGAGRGVVGGGREGGYREEGRKIWFLAQGFDRPSPDVCVCVCGRTAACADGR